MGVSQESVWYRHSWIYPLLDTLSITVILQISRHSPHTQSQCRRNSCSSLRSPPSSRIHSLLSSVLDLWDWLEQAWEKLLTIFKSLQAMTSSKYNWNSLDLHLKTSLSRLRTISSLWKLYITPRVRMDPPILVSSARSSGCRVVLYQSS